MDDQNDDSNRVVSDKSEIAARRKAAGIPPDADKIGLALSGGGIRSATFCFGLIRALAANRVLRRFDYLSTISGGGYIGATLGRLYKSGANVDQVEAGLESENSILLWWLRSNGRYLIPHGLGDVLQAWASHVRGFLGSQLNVAVIALVFAGLVVLPHLIAQTFGVPPDWQAQLRVAYTLWWDMLPIPIFVACTTICAYWSSRDKLKGSLVKDLVFYAAYVFFGYLLFLAINAIFKASPSDARHLRLDILCGVAALQISIPVGDFWQSMLRRPPADKRIFFTSCLAWALGLTFIIFIIGLLDVISWSAYWVLLGQPDFRLLGFLPALVAAVLAIVRTGFPVLLAKNAESTKFHVPLIKLGNILGLLTMIVVTLGWLIVLQALVFSTFSDAAATAEFNVYANSAAIHWLLIIGFILLYIGLNINDLDQLNWSSLHPFYRSRLARTYVSVGNYPPLGAQKTAERFPISPLEQNSRARSNQIEKLSRLLVGDDVDMCDYQPHVHGGPIHLISCCVNQTKDDRTGNYNADRKGVCLTVSSLGVEIGAHGPEKTRVEPEGVEVKTAAWAALEKTCLSQWVAISGAAVSSGMGSKTMPGLSALLFLSGFRLGFWWHWKENKFVSKYFAVFSELFARFPGLRSPADFLSDGGHFDNTGVYALLKRRLPLIVLADCGADPNFLFFDLENLVRKARIDYSIDIDFVDPTSLPLSTNLGESLLSCFGVPDTIAPGEPDNAYFLLARITYSDGKCGALLVVKPRRIEQLPLDIAGYADLDQDFPQQSTADQFFDEAQWESYEQLGRILGSKIDNELIDALPTWVSNAKTIGTGVLSPQPDKRGTAPPTRRQRIAATVGASLGIGALASIIFAGWQAWDHQASAATEIDLKNAQSFQAQVKEYQAQLQSIHQFLENFDPDEQSWEILNKVLEQLQSLNLVIPDSDATPENQKALDQLVNYMDTYCSDIESKDVATQCSAHKPTLSRERADGPFIRALNQYWSRPEQAVVFKHAVANLYGAQDAATKAKSEMSARILDACRQPVGNRLTLYIQIYSEAEREQALKVVGLANDSGLATAEVENVTSTASKLHKKPPIPWHKVTWLYHGDAGMRCANAAREWLQTSDQQLALIPGAQDASLNNIELWIPPDAKGQ